MVVYHGGMKEYPSGSSNRSLVYQDQTTVPSQHNF